MTFGERKADLWTDYLVESEPSLIPCYTMTLIIVDAICVLSYVCMYITTHLFNLDFQNHQNHTNLVASWISVVVLYDVRS